MNTAALRRTAAGGCYYQSFKTVHPEYSKNTADCPEVSQTRGHLSSAVEFDDCVKGPSMPHVCLMKTSLSHRNGSTRKSTRPLLKLDPSLPASVSDTGLPVTSRCSSSYSKRRAVSRSMASWTWRDFWSKSSLSCVALTLPPPSSSSSSPSPC